MNGKRHLCTLVLVSMCSLLGLGTVQARITHVVVDSTEPSEGGTYEKLTGRAFGEVDPADALDAVITDLEFAPRNARGRVEYVTRFTLNKPRDMAKASGVLWYDLVNRGRPVSANRSPSALGQLASRPEQFGHVSLVSGWQGDLEQLDDNWTVQVPVARNPDGSSITGVVLARLANAPAGTGTRPLAVLGTRIPYDAASLDTRRARLVSKGGETRGGEVTDLRELAPDQWAFSDCTRTPFPGQPDPRSLCLKDGFDPARLYELTYEAKDPLVLGLGLAAMRDVASFFRYEAQDDRGNRNPVAGAIHHAVAQGISQSGNALKTFLLLGFNQDEARRRVFDGANPHIAGRLTSVNLRFGLPSGSGTLYEPGGEGVLWWTPYEDAVRSRPRASLLDRCTASDTCPKIFETFGASEFNARLMTVALTGTGGRADLPVPSNVRRYYFPGTTHGGGPGGFEWQQPRAEGCTLQRNPNPEDETMNALQVALVDWVVADTPPPPSAYPTLASGDLVANTAEAMGFPLVPGGASPTGMAVGLSDYDFGPGLRYNDFSGVLQRQPPSIRQVIPARMPRVNADGNETSGIASVLHQAPLGTYTGWNATASGFFRGQPCGGGLTGGYVPFARSRAEREAGGDPRPSLAERYGSQRGYLCAVRTAVNRNVAARMLLPADGRTLVEQASAFHDLPAEAADEAGRGTEERLCRGAPR